MTYSGAMQTGILSLTILVTLALWPFWPARAQLEFMGDLHQEQAKEKAELEKMRDEMNDVRSTIGDSMHALGQMGAQINRAQHMKEFHIIAKEADWELFPGTTARCLTYNGQMPGPSIRVQEGDLVRVVLHNELKVPTSLYFHGLLAPHGVNGLPRQGAGLVGPGETFAFQFVAQHPGTFWYHPQVVHADQQTRGLYGALVVEPKSMPKTFERDFLVVVGQHTLVPRAASAAAKPHTVGQKVNAAYASGLESVSPVMPSLPPSATTYFSINGKSAPGIPPMEVHKGERVRLRVINAAQTVCPIHLTGHRFEVVTVNGADGLEPHVTRDSVALQAGDRVDLEFSADNPGVWSLASGLISQTTNNGKFPGGVAWVVRYLPESPGK